MSDVPLKIRVDVRDIWNAKGQSLQVAVDELTKALGLRVEPEGQWGPMWSALGPNFTDIRYFVVSIAHIVTSWYRGLTSRVERGYDPKWTEQLLHNLQQAGNAAMVVRLAPNSSRICSGWDKDLKKLYIGLPSDTALQMNSKTYDFGRDFDGFFPAPPPPPPASVAGNLSGPFTVAAPVYAAAYVPTVPQAGSQQPVWMPTVENTPRLSDLLRQLPVHYLIFYHSFPARIQCSHEPTLVFLADYLTKHGRVNDNDSQRRTIFKMEFQNSKFASGTQDLLIISSHTEFRANVVDPTLILAVVEGVLGYKRVEDMNGAFVFRHNTGFA